jgi:proteasome lid subunit RPN8/RPN11
VKEITINRGYLEDILQHAIDARPKEACGILAGRNNTIERVFKMVNTDASPVSYAFDSVEQLNVTRNIEREGLDLVAVYHSHPSSPAYPSQVDIQRAFFPGTEEPNFPDIAYVIIGLMESEPEVKAYSISGKRDIIDVLIRTDLH